MRAAAPRKPKPSSRATGAPKAVPWGPSSRPLAPTRRGLVLIDPPYEIKTDYARTLTALREALARFAECTVIVWSPQLQLLEAAKLPQRLKAAATDVAPKGWLLARLSVAAPRERGARIPPFRPGLRARARAGMES